MPQPTKSRIKDTIGAALASLLLLGCFCIQASVFSLSIETAELAENHNSGLSSAKDNEANRSLSDQIFPRNKTGNGKSEEYEGGNVRCKRSGGQSPRKGGLFESLPPDALCFVPIAIRIHRMASGNTSSFVSGDFHKQIFARAGPVYFLRVS